MPIDIATHRKNIVSPVENTCQSSICQSFIHKKKLVTLAQKILREEGSENKGQGLDLKKLIKAFCKLDSKEIDSNFPDVEDFLRKELVNQKFPQKKINKLFLPLDFQRLKKENEQYTKVSQELEKAHQQLAQLQAENKYARGNYNEKNLTQRFLKKIEDLASQDNFQAVKNFLVDFKQANSSVSQKANSLINEMSKDPAISERIKIRLEKNIKSPDESEINAKHRLLALKLLFQSFLSPEGEVSHFSLWSKRTSVASHKKIFGENSRATVVANYDLNLSISGQLEKITLVDYKELGSGTYNEVFDVYCLEYERRFVIRELRTHVSYALQAFSLWEDETKIHKHLMQEGVQNIVKLHAVYSSGQAGSGITAHLMDNYGGDLRKHAGKLDDEKLKSIMSQVLSATVQTHHLGYTHRDIKVDNIFCTNDFKVYLADFGLSGKIGSNQPKYVGSREYMSPETCFKYIGACPYPDCWALALAAYELKFGPFNKSAKDLTHPIHAFRDVIDQMYHLEAWLRCLEKECTLEDALQRVFQNYPELFYLPEMQAMMDNPNTWNFITIHNNILLKYLFPEMRIVVEKMKKSLKKPFSPYDEMLNGLFEVFPYERFTAQQALDCLLQNNGVETSTSINHLSLLEVADEGFLI